MRELRPLNKLGHERQSKTTKCKIDYINRNSTLFTSSPFNWKCYGTTVTSVAESTTCLFMTSVSLQTIGVWTMPEYRTSRTYYYYSRNPSRMTSLHWEASAKPGVLSNRQFLAVHHQAKHLPHSSAEGLVASLQPSQLGDTVSKEHPEAHLHGIL